MNIQWNHLNAGDTFDFGRYAPEGDFEASPITWRVLAREDHRMLVLSEYILDLQPFHDGDQPIRREDSQLRQWLNTTFLSAAFTEEEQALICQPEPNEDPLGQFLWEAFGMETGTNGIQYRVFLLNQSDVITYFPGNGLFYPGSQAQGTQQVQQLTDDDLCWWLRSTMQEWGAAMIVSPSSSIGMSVLGDDNCQGVRPAMWVTL